jgi:uncharacterized membrane protein
LYDLSVAIHVTAAIVGFGVTFSYPVIQIAAELRDRRALPFALATILAISRWVAVPATLIVGVTGVYQLTSGPYGLHEAWLATGLALYIVVMSIGLFYFTPSYRRGEREARRMVDAAHAGEEITLTPEYRAALRGPNVLGPPVAAAIVAIAVLMVVKPG